MNNIIAKTETAAVFDYASMPDDHQTAAALEMYIPYEVRHAIAGRIRVVSEAFMVNKYLGMMVSNIIGGLPGVTEISLNSCCGSMTIYYDENVIDKTEILRNMSAITMNVVVTSNTFNILFEKSMFTEVKGNAGANWFYEIAGVLLAAFGVVMVILPGIPGIPILLLAAYFLAKGAGPVYKRLIRNNYFGKYLQKPEQLAITDADKQQQ
ncbi:MAG: DUF454 family protein [Candidatus Magnetominusculus sp. LBB02]|nr:DUF454 family protein [Candidatus Magnetominusculus sp. LBB02]